MKALCRLKDMLEMEMEDLTQGGKLSTSDVELAYKMVDIIKDIETIKAMSEYDDDDYSDRGSYRRGGNSREGRYSRRENMRDGLRAAMREASSEGERETIRRMMDRI